MEPISGQTQPHISGFRCKGWVALVKPLPRLSEVLPSIIHHVDNDMSKGNHLPSAVKWKNPRQLQRKKGASSRRPNVSITLFVLIMDYLTRLLIFYADKKGYGFHPLCKHLRLTNLCFADDLAIFCKGNYNSVRLTFEAFQKFCDATGLSANTSKSHIYFGRVSEEIKSKILDLVHIEEGSFPLKYLGVNLRPTKWKVTGCGIILDKVNKNLNCWASKNLSFAGRAEMIHSVLLGIRNFWMSIFIIPSKITAAIDKSCRDYLWGTTGNRIYLKEHDIWNYPQKMDDSWYFKKNLSLRETMDEDRMCLAVKGNKLRAKRYYDLLVEVDKVDYARAVWDKLIVPKHRFLFWQIGNTQLLTKDFLSQIMTISSALCPVCEVELETHEHLFFTCCFAKQVVVETSLGLESFNCLNLLRICLKVEKG
uniref:Reverse transcriptase domain-containing protein n=1 Tax=Cannabis sativa TaxID=3483 RepID=A0A803PLK1_CANSA